MISHVFITDYLNFRRTSLSAVRDRAFSVAAVGILNQSASARNPVILAGSLLRQSTSEDPSLLTVPPIMVKFTRGRLSRSTL